ncbi:uncharacterized protein MELLADRAFT_113261 [Melampsora larici-populina 98AG31]|uniref:Uncharacterized protein n=1 Tax=Melampsora larici-populina (strain 98AG31 / pathotype 3-4-7) TaxID=747676 RepID=F4S9A2_MELLP|nr:uncharacterized protein MELLADRAFT_113261 [Melampsora larici-populina 98AG31]EGF98801.1 hypothetical protein MELLADRAFT_113261 [Melampsora larici-populina 98AG31]
MNSETSSSLSDASLPIINKTLPPMYFTGMSSRNPLLNSHPVAGESLPSEVKEASSVLPLELIASRSEAVISIPHHTQMASDIIIKKPERLNENITSINASTIHKFDPFEDRPSYHPRSSVLTSARPTGDHDDEEAPSGRAKPRSSRTFEDTRNVDPLSESYLPPFPPPQTTNDGRRDILIGTSTFPPILGFTGTNIIYADYRLSPPMMCHDVGRFHQESDRSEAQHTLYTPDIGTSSRTSTRDSNVDHPGCESSDSDSIDDKMIGIAGESKAVTKDEVSLFSSDKVPQKAIPSSKAIWKSSSTYKDLDVSEGEEADVDEPSSSHNRFIKKRKCSDSLVTLMSRLSNTTLSIRPTMVVYDSKVKRSSLARMRLSVKRPVSDEKSDEFVKRVRLVNGLNHKK